MALTKEEEKILQKIIVPSENNPDQPEFPPDSPKFPATPTVKIQMPGFKHVWLKDESVNPSGTHKDRMAWEIVVTYKSLLLSKQKGRINELPRMSIISSGSAANAIQRMLANYSLPNLKVLVDYRINKQIRKKLEMMGCEIYETDLSKKALNTQEILHLTNNVGGVDITSDSSLGPYTVFYDWMSYEILNENPEYVFIPYGTGNLFENIVNVAVKESKNIFFHDKRLKINSDIIGHCNFLGATTNNPDTEADKIYSPHLPFVHFDTDWIKLAITKGYIGEESNVYNVQEKYFGRAMEIAKKNKINCEPSGIAGLALLLQMNDKIPKDKKILIVNTGKTKLDR